MFEVLLYVFNHILVFVQFKSNLIWIFQQITGIQKQWVYGLAGAEGIICEELTFSDRLSSQTDTVRARFAELSSHIEIILSWEDNSHNKSKLQIW